MFFAQRTSSSEIFSRTHVNFSMLLLDGIFFRPSFDRTFFCASFSASLAAFLAALSFVFASFSSSFAFFFPSLASFSSSFASFFSPLAFFSDCWLAFLPLFCCLRFTFLLGVFFFLFCLLFPLFFSPLRFPPFYHCAHLLHLPLGAAEESVRQDLWIYSRKTNSDHINCSDQVSAPLLVLQSRFWVSSTSLNLQLMDALVKAGIIYTGLFAQAAPEKKSRNEEDG